MEREAAQAAYDALHKDMEWHDGSFQSWAKERSASHPYHFRYGVKIGVAAADLTPYDAFTTEIDASPIPPEDDDDQVPAS